MLQNCRHDLRGSASCNGSELLYEKMAKVLYNADTNPFIGPSLQAECTMTETTNYPDNITALYACLSQEDTLNRDDNSIVDQRNILPRYATDNGFSNPTFFIDHGVSGGNFR